MATLQASIDQNYESRPYESLSFCSADNLWQVSSSGDYSKDCEIGQNIADELADYIRRTDNPSFLSHVCQAIGDTTATGIEVGFYHRLGLALMRDI